MTKLQIDLWERYDNIGESQIIGSDVWVGTYDRHANKMNYTASGTVCGINYTPAMTGGYSVYIKTATGELNSYYVGDVYTKEHRKLIDERIKLYDMLPSGTFRHIDTHYAIRYPEDALPKALEGQIWRVKYPNYVGITLTGAPIKQEIKTVKIIEAKEYDIIVTEVYKSLFEGKGWEPKLSDAYFKRSWKCWYENLVERIE